MSPAALACIEKPPQACYSWITGASEAGARGPAGRSDMQLDEKTREPQSTPPSVATEPEAGRGDDSLIEDIRLLGRLLGDAVREPLKMIACLVGAAMVSWRLLLLTIIVAPMAALSMYPSTPVI